MNLAFGASIVVLAALAPVIRLPDNCEGCLAIDGPPGVASSGGVTLSVSATVVDGVCWDAGGGDCHDSPCHATIYRSWTAPRGTELYYCEKDLSIPNQPTMCEEDPHVASGGSEDGPSQEKTLQCGESASYKLKHQSFTVSVTVSCGECG